MKSSPTDLIIFFRDMETFPVAATVSGISFVSSIVFSTSSSNNEIYVSNMFLRRVKYLDGLSDGVRDGELYHVILCIPDDEYIIIHTRRVRRREEIIKGLVLSTVNGYRNQSASIIGRWVGVGT
jgi:hypothetical protein